MDFANIIRALRLPFITASVLPFIFGTFIAGHRFQATNFILGLATVALAHLSANLMNDYADSKTGVDWQDKNFYKFFGGSKLIQENKFSEKFYLYLAVSFSLLALASIVALSVRLGLPALVLAYLAILALAWAYSSKPFRFSYRRLGELVIFICFGPVLVMGGYFIQTHKFISAESFFLSLPFGFLTTAILFANEIPDYPQDSRAGKLTWVTITGQQKAFILYDILVFFAFCSIAINIRFGFLGPVSLFSFVFILLALRAADILRKHWSDKIKLMVSSQMTIAMHSIVSLVLISDALLWKRF